jgi:hypothetical protein
LCRLRSAVNDHPPKTPKLLKERKKGEKKTRTEVLRVSNPNFAKEGRRKEERKGGKQSHRSLY